MISLFADIPHLTGEMRSSEYTGGPMISLYADIPHLTGEMRSSEYTGGPMISLFADIPHLTGEMRSSEYTGGPMISLFADIPHLTGEMRSSEYTGGPMISLFADIPHLTGEMRSSEYTGGPMISLFGDIPSPLMPMIAPDKPCERPMVNLLGGGGSPNPTTGEGTLTAGSYLALDARPRRGAHQIAEAAPAVAWEWPGSPSAAWRRSGRVRPSGRLARCWASAKR